MKKLIVNSLTKAGTHLLVKLLVSMSFQYCEANISSVINRAHRNPMEKQA